MAEILAARPPFVEANLGGGPSWSESLKNAVRSGRKLLDLLKLSPDLASAAAEEDFQVFAPLEYIRRMRPGDSEDPLLLQVLATPSEVSSSESLTGNGLLDPVGDRSAEVLPGLLRKYHGRALLIASGACAIHCRYCFRRHFPYASAPHNLDQWQPVIDHIAQDDSLDEVILSGGDPLMLVDSSLTWMIRQLDKIPHLRRIRIHSRFPVVIPQRVSPDLLTWIRDTRCAIYFVLHINHVQEIDESLARSLTQLRKAGATLLNQSVLLRGINDTTQAQRELCLKLCDLQVLPYYLHQLDPVQGAMHFQVPDSQAAQIVEHLREFLPGYAVPRLVREVAGQPYKVPLEFDNYNR